MATREEAKSWKAETKFTMANERTLLAWLRLASTLGIGAFLGVSSGKGIKEEGRSVGVFQMLVAVLIVIYAFVQLHRRGLLCQSLARANPSLRSNLYESTVCHRSSSYVGGAGGAAGAVARYS